VKFDEEGAEFDMGLKLNLPDFEDKGWLEITKSLLPGKVSASYHWVSALFGNSRRLS
jgi:hypothetical protein